MGSNPSKDHFYHGRHRDLERRIYTNIGFIFYSEYDDIKRGEWDLTGNKKAKTNFWRMIGLGDNEVPDDTIDDAGSGGGAGTPCCTVSGDIIDDTERPLVDASGGGNIVGGNGSLAEKIGAGDHIQESLSGDSMMTFKDHPLFRVHWTQKVSENPHYDSWGTVESWEADGRVLRLERVSECELLNGTLVPNVIARATLALKSGTELNTDCSFYNPAVAGVGFLTSQGPEYRKPRRGLRLSDLPEERRIMLVDIGIQKYDAMIEMVKEGEDPEEDFPEYLTAKRHVPALDKIDPSNRIDPTVVRSLQDTLFSETIDGSLTLPLCEGIPLSDAPPTPNTGSEEGKGSSVLQGGKSRLPMISTIADPDGLKKVLKKLFSFVEEEKRIPEGPNKGTVETIRYQFKDSKTGEMYKLCFRVSVPLFSAMEFHFGEKDGITRSKHLPAKSYIDESLGHAPKMNWKRPVKHEKSNIVKSNGHKFDASDYIDGGRSPKSDRGMNQGGDRSPKGKEKGNVNADEEKTKVVLGVEDLSRVTVLLHDCQAYEGFDTKMGMFGSLI